MDVDNWLNYARQFHGHICPYVALGIRASIVLLDKLGIEKASPLDTINENLLAIVECNNCFFDGVQLATGCTVGNNSLIYLNVGKNALTLVRREGFEGYRLYMDADKVKKYFPKKGLELFDKVVKQRNATNEEINELKSMWEALGHKMFEINQDIFTIKKVKVQPIERAPIFDSLRCEACNELVMATNAVNIDGKNYCLSCANKSYPILVGRGIINSQFEIRSTQ